MRRTDEKRPATADTAPGARDHHGRNDQSQPATPRAAAQAAPTLRCERCNAPACERTRAFETELCIACAGELLRRLERLWRGGL